MTTKPTNQLPLLFLNRVKLDQEPCIKLYFHDSEPIIHRIKQNDWIDYSIELKAYYTRERKNTIPLLQDLFEDIAQVRIDKLEWKKLSALSMNVGSNKINYFELQHKPQGEGILIQAVQLDSQPYFMFKHFFRRELYNELVQSPYFIRHRANNIWLIPSSQGALRHAIYFLMKHFTIRLSKEIHISDMELKRSLLEQSYIKDGHFKTCPIEFMNYLQQHNYSENTLVTYHRVC